ncbi:MAG: stage V sporulation protein B, partial [Oscillospiraceae bacterium]
YVIGFVVSSILGVALCWWDVHRATGLPLQIFNWMVSPALASLLTGLAANLLFQVLLAEGLTSLCASLWVLLFGTVLYLFALAAQGVHPLALFRLS